MKHTPDILWETPTYQNPKSAQIADFQGMRLYCHRVRPGARVFIGKINGERVGSWDTLEMAMSQTAKIAAEVHRTKQE